MHASAVLCVGSVLSSYALNAAIFVASHTRSTMESQPPACSMYDANAHWQTHQFPMGHMPLWPMQGCSSSHQSGWPVTVQKSDFIWMQMWCEPASSSPASVQRPSRINPVKAVPGFEHVLKLSPRILVAPEALCERAVFNECAATSSWTRPRRA